MSAKILIRYGKTDHLLNAGDIICLEADGRYTQIVTLAVKMIICRNIGELEKELPDGFIRIHNKFIVNSGYIKNVNPGKLILTNGKEIPISVRKRKTLKDKLKEFVQITHLILTGGILILFML